MRRMVHRGVSLVEMALVLAIIGLTMGVYLSHSQGIAQEQRWEDAERELAAIRESVVLYAAKNKTAQREVVVYNRETGRVVSEDSLPAGRPILPCPDVNGDGVEDRQKEGAMPEAGAVLTIMIETTPARLSDAENPLMAHGNCVMQKGALPWRSLPGVFRETDPWGNLYTYRVDSNFSNRLIGFDQYTRADSYDARQPWTSDGGGLAPWPVKRATDPAEMPRRVWPPYVEDGAVVPAPAVMITVNERPSVICQRAPCPPRLDEIGDNPVLAGSLATTAVSLITAQPFVEGAPLARVARTFAPPGDVMSEVEIMSGAPFVVLSHGREDGGARVPPRKAPAGNVRGVFMNLLDPFRASDVHNAMDFGLGQISAGDRVSYDGVLRSGSFASLGDGGFAVLDAQVESGERAWGPRLRAPLMDNGFVQPRGVRVVEHNLEDAAAQPVHDDVVTWMTTEELIQGAHRLKFLPARPLPPFGVSK